jgi:hypothetical protein
MINLSYELAARARPLAGEAACRTAILRRIVFFSGYAARIGLLVDFWRRLGLAALGRIDLGQRHRRHQATVALGRMGCAIVQAMLDSSRPRGARRWVVTAAGPFARPVRRACGFVMETAGGELVRRPPRSLMG